MKIKNLIQNKRGFTIIEFMMAMTMFVMVFLAALQSLGVFSFAKFYTTNRIELEQELHFFVEQLTSIIKVGGNIDYEEYWNRKVVGMSTSSGHYDLPTGFGNYGYNGALGVATYGSGFYYCLSGDGTSMGTGGCLVTNNIAGQYTGSALNVNFSGAYQRYGQFAIQFIDYNENKNDDVGNEDRDGSGNIMGDDDDKNLGMGPDPIGTGAYKELYLIKKNERGKYERLLIRWYVRQDPDVLYGATCDFSGPSPTGSGCLGNVQILRLMGEDFGLTHDGNGNTAYDGKIDTWFCHIDWKEQCQGPDVLGEKLPAGLDSEWVNVFPEFINVKNIEFYLAPKNDSNLAWGNGDLSDYIHPYVRLRVTLGFSWERKKLLHLKKMEDMDMTISTTINLNEFDL